MRGYFIGLVNGPYISGSRFAHVDIKAMFVVTKKYKIRNILQKTKKFHTK